MKRFLSIIAILLMLAGTAFAQHPGAWPTGGGSSTPGTALGDLGSTGYPYCTYAGGSCTWSIGTGGAVTFNAVGTGTNTTATMTCGTGCTINTSGSGVNAATSLGALTGMPPQAANTIVGNNAASPAAPIAMTVVQAQTLLGLSTDGSTASISTETHFLKKHTDSTIQDQLIVERIGATFDGGGSAITVNKLVDIYVPYAVAAINTWTVQCDQNSGGQGIIFTLYLDAYAEDTAATTTMCTTGTAPHTSNSGAGQKVHRANWDCNITAIPAGSMIKIKVTTAPTSHTQCTLTLKVTR